MQTPKTRPGSQGVPQRTSHPALRTARKIKTPGSDSDSISSPNQKRASRVSGLETQFAQLQEELKRTKDQLSSSESWKRRVQHKAEEAKQLVDMSAELEETREQLLELSDSEEVRVQELCKISQDRDRARQTELEANEKRQSMESAALASAMNEIQMLKFQLDRVAESESSEARHVKLAYATVQSLRLELMETIELVEKLKTQLSESRESEARALEEVSRAQMKLEIFKTMEETIKSECINAMEPHKYLVELDQSKNIVNSLDEHLVKLQTDLDNGSKISADPSHDTKNGGCEESKLLKIELNNLRLEVSKLRAALDNAERRYQSEYIQSTLQIRSAHESMESAKPDSRPREAELEAELKVSRDEVEELRAKLIEKENLLQSILYENLKSEANQPKNSNTLQTERETELEIKLKKSELVLADLKDSLSDKETRIQSLTAENDMLKSEIKEKQIEKCMARDEALALAEELRAAEQDALTKLANLTEEANTSSRKCANVTEKLDAEQAANSEMEAELRRLKVQSDQWRKAAEAAAAMLSPGTNAKHVERTKSLDDQEIGGNLVSPYSEDMDDDSPKKKNGNMLKKFSVLLKKGQK